MLSNVYSEGNFFRFGSGYLLNDLIRYINFDNNEHNKKIIFIGDNAQLPPIDMNFSPALDRNYLRENCNLISSEFELTEVVRQKADSGILHNATKLRNFLKANNFNQLDIETNFKDINKTGHEEFLSKYLKACNNTIDDETIIIAYSNSSVKEYNDSVRNHFFPNQYSIMVGDKVILTSNNYNYPQMELLNGDFGYVKAVSPITESRTIALKQNEIDVRLIFRDVIITFTDEEFNKHDIECKIIENLLYSNQRDLSSDEFKAIYIDFKNRNRHIHYGTQEFKRILRNDEYFNALRIKFGYAVTCQKAQGGEWENTFFDCKASMGFKSSYFRWLYTGITRAKEKLFLINERNLQQTNIKDITDFSISYTPFFEQDFLREFYERIKSKLEPLNLQITKIEHKPYHEIYEFKKNDLVATYIFWYDGSNTFNKMAVIPERTTGLAKEINELLNLQTVEIDNANNSVVRDFLTDFYEKVKRKLELLNFNITKIEHKPYHEIYEIRKNGFVATYKFWYNGKNRFTKMAVIPERTTGLVQEINTLLINIIS